jgi:hypothetical protein
MENNHEEVQDQNGNIRLGKMSHIKKAYGVEMRDKEF